MQLVVTSNTSNRNYYRVFCLSGRNGKENIYMGRMFKLRQKIPCTHCHAGKVGSLQGVRA